MFSPRPNASPSTRNRKRKGAVSRVAVRETAAGEESSVATSRFAGRWRRVVPGVVLVVVGPYVLLQGAGALYRYVATAPRFEVRAVRYDETTHLSRDALREQLAIEPGTNILALDLEALAARVAAHPWVAHASVSRTLPDTLHVTVHEHAATAVLHAEVLALVNEAGVPFKTLEANERGDLPLVTGIARKDWLFAPLQARARLQQALDVLALYREKQRPQLSEVHIDASARVTLYTEATGTALRLGREHYREALARYDALRAATGDAEAGFTVIHLDDPKVAGEPERVVARLAEPNLNVST